MEQANPITQALLQFKTPGGSNIVPTRNSNLPQDFSGTDDYHINMSNWMHNQIGSGAWNNMSGKEIVNAFNKQKNVINNNISQKMQQALAAMQSGAINPPNFVSRPSAPLPVPQNF